MLSKSLRGSRSITLGMRTNALRRSIFYDSGKYEHAEPEKDKQLRSDIKTLGNILGKAIKNESQEVYEAVESLRSYGREVTTALFEFIKLKLRNKYYVIF